MPINNINETLYTRTYHIFCSTASRSIDYRAILIRSTYVLHSDLDTIKISCVTIVSRYYEGCAPRSALQHAQRRHKHHIGSYLTICTICKLGGGRKQQHRWVRSRDATMSLLADFERIGSPAACVNVSDRSKIKKRWHVASAERKLLSKACREGIAWKT